MRALVPNLVFARHHGLLFGLPFLRVVGFFNEHFDPTQVWRWCLRDPEEGKKKTKRKNISHSLRATSELWCPLQQPHRDPRDLVFILSPLGDRREFVAALSSHNGVGFLWKVQQQMTNVR